ncbi:response regulator transcription factor [Aureliella helgolandensis]|uniref:Photosynthetic apparatus regulatory protein RegA n=1 Tax=Aureliella helgolandensis TaxID=2527968 RepID=A0A518GE46_9BACT|nr:response regulator [Aureliella helgolandensis]QDV26871.1 Photosynthetic apparatus regulatory protein RegA [Aureliella helgolandensis]
MAEATQATRLIKDRLPDSIESETISHAQSILLVDDSIVLRDRLALAFQERGFRVAVASCFDEAVLAFQTEPTDLAVLDLRMPGKPGLVLLQELKRLSPETQFLILSGFGSIATAIDAIRLGAANFLPKPADADDILTAFARGGTEVHVSKAEEEIPVPTLAQAEWEHIHRILADCGGNISEAARRLGIHRRSLQRKLRKRAP